MGRCNYSQFSVRDVCRQERDHSECPSTRLFPWLNWVQVTNDTLEFCTHESSCRQINHQAQNAAHMSFTTMQTHESQPHLCLAWALWNVRTGCGSLVLYMFIAWVRWHVKRADTQYFRYKTTLKDFTSKNSLKFKAWTELSRVSRLRLDQDGKCSFSICCRQHRTSAIEASEKANYYYFIPRVDMLDRYFL